MHTDDDRHFILRLQHLKYTVELRGEQAIIMVRLEDCSQQTQSFSLVKDSEFFIQITSEGIINNKTQQKVTVDQVAQDILTTLVRAAEQG